MAELYEIQRVAKGVIDTETETMRFCGMVHGKVLSSCGGTLDSMNRGKAIGELSSARPSRHQGQNPSEFKDLSYADEEGVGQQTLGHWNALTRSHWRGLFTSVRYRENDKGPRPAVGNSESNPVRVSRNWNNIHEKRAVWVQGKTAENVERTERYIISCNLFGDEVGWGIEVKYSECVPDTDHFGYTSASATILNMRLSIEQESGT
ncbi:hypothetical protein B0H16DRAFT_1473632 [Mycena metata]|uniref:Uncharacterized protein n=1 Tax=Mycena metata TaxID=1033252 RepID=A0AAD7HJ34_9AGAR|nr:hypothetical protein B0H16DRAFT_1473632 [Mycena metata]